MESRSRDRGTPFNKFSPSGRKHPRMTSSTGSAYKCRDGFGIVEGMHIYDQLHVAQSEMMACLLALETRDPNSRDEYERRSNHAFVRGALRGCRLYRRILERAREYALHQRSSESCRARNLRRLDRHDLKQRSMCERLQAFMHALGPDDRRRGSPRNLNSLFDRMEI